MFELIVIGVSTGGLQALAGIMKNLPEDFDIPMIIIAGADYNNEDMLSNYLDKRYRLKVKTAENGEKIRKGYVYLAPTAHHLLVENDHTFAVWPARPGRTGYSQLDALLESAGLIFRAALIGIILSGSEDEGAIGIRTLSREGGLVIVQDPASAREAHMPMAVIREVDVDYIVDQEEIAPLLGNLACQPPSTSGAFRSIRNTGKTYR